MKSKSKKIRIPFHPVILPLFCLLFTFLVGGVAAGLNWTRLSKPQWKYPTIGITVLGFALFLLVFRLIPLSWSRFMPYISYAVFAGIGVLLYFIQKPYYDAWKLGS